MPSDQAAIRGHFLPQQYADDDEPSVDRLRPSDAHPAARVLDMLVQHEPSVLDAALHQLRVPAGALSAALRSHRLEHSPHAAAVLGQHHQQFVHEGAAQSAAGEPGDAAAGRDKRQLRHVSVRGDFDVVDR